jgi:hypothetical protein
MASTRVSGFGEIDRCTMSKRGRGQNRTGRSEKTTRYFQTEHWIMEHPGWLALSPHTKLLLFVMQKRHNGFNNGQIGFGVRSGVQVPSGAGRYAETAFGLSRFQIGRALAEAEAAGFIVCTKGSSFDQKKLTREWRLTWLPSGDRGTVPPSKEFASRNVPKNQKPGALVHIPPLYRSTSAHTSWTHSAQTRLTGAPVHLWGILIGAPVHHM